MSVHRGNDVGKASIRSVVTPVEAPPARADESDEPPPNTDRMDWRGRYRSAVSFLVVLTFVFLTLVFILAHGKVADPDIWWHLHNADYLIHHHSLPRYDMYSFTVPGHPWMNHEWLAELPYYFAWRVLGLSGIDAVAVTVLSLIFLGVLCLSYRECGNYKAAVLASSYAVFLGSVSFGPRTILFGYAYLVVLLLVLQRFRRKGQAPLWLIPPLFCLWVNTHGSWFIGIIIFSIIVAGGLVRLKWGMIDSEPWTPAQRKSLLLAWGASLAVLFVNPFGAHLVFYPLDLAFRQTLNIEHVGEWVSVNFHDARGKFVIVLLIILLVSSLLRPRRWTLSELVVALFVLYSGLTYERFLFLLGIVIAPVLAKILDFVPPYRRELDTPVINAFAILLMTAAIVHYWPRQSQLQRSVDDQYPLQAISYLEAHPPSGPIVNYYLWGGYLNWKDPDLKVFIDGRADIFEYSGVFKDYLSLLGLNAPEAILDKYKARYVLFPRHEPFTYFMEHDPKWKTIYSDQLSILLE
ncbi:MAG: hypothetical protein WCA20_01195, partial [Candidatus Sulfotelmatobacter sp.]